MASECTSTVMATESNQPVKGIVKERPKTKKQLAAEAKALSERRKSMIKWSNCNPTTLTFPITGGEVIWTGGGKIEVDDPRNGKLTVKPENGVCVYGIEKGTKSIVTISFANAPTFVIRLFGNGVKCVYSNLSPDKLVKCEMFVKLYFGDME